MDKGKLNSFKRMLLEKKRELLREVNRNQESGKESRPDELKDIADMASDAYEREFLFGLSDSEKKLLSEIEDALYRIEKGTYGKCDRCGKEINSGRLEALPFARLCISCKTKEENRKVRE